MLGLRHRTSRLATATLALLACLALVFSVPSGSATGPSGGGEDAAVAKKKKKCKKGKKKGRKGAESAKKKKCKKKKKKPNEAASGLTVRASLAWSIPSRDVDLIVQHTPAGGATQGAGPPGAFGQYFGLHVTPPPISDSLHSGEVAGGPETFTDLNPGLARALEFIACVPRAGGGPITLTLTVYDPPAFAPRIVTQTVDVPDPGSGVKMGASPAGSPTTGGDPCA